MKTLITSAVAAFSIAASAFTVNELNNIKVDDIAAADIEAAFDAAIATTNTGRITEFVAKGKMPLEDAVHKTMAKKPFKMCLAAFNGDPKTTNYTLQAEALAGLNYADFDNITFDYVKRVMTRHWFCVTEVGQAEVARMYKANKLFGAEIYCSCYLKPIRNAFADTKAPEAYEAVKHLVKTCGCPRMAAVLWQYNTFAKDYSYFESMYDKSLVSVYFTWLYDYNRQYKLAVDLLEAWKAVKPANSKTDANIVRVAKSIDKISGTKTATLNAIDNLFYTKAKLNAALYCNNIDKALEVLIACDTSLEAKDIDKAIAAINALDPDYKPVEVLKALKAVNQRYTLKLYDDRDTWEPTLSKLRAMIEIR